MAVFPNCHGVGTQSTTSDRLSTYHDVRVRGYSELQSARRLIMTIRSGSFWVTWVDSTPKTAIMSKSWLRSAGLRYELH